MTQAFCWSSTRGTSAPGASPKLRARSVSPRSREARAADAVKFASSMVSSWSSTHSTPFCLLATHHSKARRASPTMDAQGTFEPSASAASTPLKSSADSSGCSVWTWSTRRRRRGASLTFRSPGSAASTAGTSGRSGWRNAKPRRSKTSYAAKALPMFRGAAALTPLPRPQTTPPTRFTT